MNDINLMLGLKLATKNIRSAIVEEQRKGNISNEAICMILKDVLLDFQDATTSDYASALGQMITSMASEAKEEK